MPDVNRVTEQVIGAAVAVHRELGPGLLESTYEACLVFELLERGLFVERQKALPVMRYREHLIDCAYRIDLLIEEIVVVELKAIERLDRVHTAQLLTDLKLTGCHVGLLINFNVPLLTQGVRRVVSGPPPS
jgi:GxxExxY protein